MKYSAVVNLTAPYKSFGKKRLFFSIGNNVCTDPFPKVFVPRIIALLLSCNAPATISEAEADPPFTITRRGLPKIKSPFLALYSLIVLSKRGLFVDTILPSSRKKFVTCIAWLSKPPGFLLRSKI